MGINDDLTVEKLLILMEKMHKAAEGVLIAHGYYGDARASESDRDAAFQELKRMADVFFKYR